jgi:hypothetical protein
MLKVNPMNRFVLSCLALALGSSAAHAQIEPSPRVQTPIRPPATAPVNLNAGPDLASQILSYERTQNADALLLAYGQAVTDAGLARAAISQLLSSYYLLRNQAQTAEQATQAVGEATLRFQVLQAAQNQVLIQQNQQLLAQNAQIIALLRDNQKAAATTR